MKNKIFLLVFFLVFGSSLWTLAQDIDFNLDKHKMLIENKGQWDEKILFQSKFQGGNLWVEQHKLLFHLQDFSSIQNMHSGAELANEEVSGLPQTVLNAVFEGSNEIKEIEKELPSTHYYNYFLGNEKKKWASEVHSYHKAILKEIYAGIDFQIIQTDDELKYEFHVAPNSDPNQIQIRYTGQNSMKLDGVGNLIIETILGTVMEKKPYVYQIINGRIVEIDCEFKLEKDLVTFQLSNYQKDATLIIDPVLVFATYCGAVSDNFGMTATYGYDGTAYAGGMVYGNSYPTPSPAYNTSSNFTMAVPTAANYGITDVFITKYNSDGTQMLWTTFLGGGSDSDGTETAQSMICDAQNNVYLYGSTSSSDFPIVNGFQSVHGGGTAGYNFTNNGVYFLGQGTDIYVAKISSNGQNLMSSTYIGGSGNDGINSNTSVSSYTGLIKNYGDQFRGEIMLDNAGNCIIGSSTRSTDFPMMNPIQSSNAGGQDGVLFRMSSNLASLQYSTYFGGNLNDAVYSVKVDSSNNIVFAGGTLSANLLGTSGKYQPALAGQADGFIGKLSGNWSSLIGTTYVGTANYDQIFFVEIDRIDNIFVVGQSENGTFPVINAAYSNSGSSQFIAKFNSNLTSILNSTVFGNGLNNVNISPSAFLVDRCGSIYVSGWGGNILQANSQLSGMPVSTDAFQANSPNGYDFYLFVLDHLFSDIIYASYLGGNLAREHVDGGTSRFDRNGVVYQCVCAGCGAHSDFPTSTNAWSATNNSTNCNNLVFKFDFETQTEAQFTVSDTASCLSEPITLANTSSGSSSSSYYWILANGDTSTLFNPVLSFTSPGVYTIQLIVTDSICNQSDTAKINITIEPDLQLSTSNDTIVCKADSLALFASSFGTATTFVWSSNSNFTDTLNENPMDSIIYVSPIGSQTYYVKIDNGQCDRIADVEVLIISNSIQLLDTAAYCEGETETISVASLVPSINFTYQWSPLSILVGPSNLAFVNTNTLIEQYLYVDVSTNLGCSFRDSIWLDVHLIGNVAVSATANPALIPAGTTTVLTANPSGAVYSWTPTSGLSNPSGQITVATLHHDTDFSVLIGDGICFDTAVVKVKVFEYVCDNPFIFVPNAFSPNGDNENDILFVRGAILESVLFRVFNRWGELVFETTDKDIGWNGTFKGKMMDPDTYDYYLKAICIDNQEKIIKGNVTLMR